MKLKPCPFCGSKSVASCKDGYGYAVFCYDCAAEMRNFSSEDEAIKAWNKRVCNDKPRELEEENKTLKQAGHRLAMCVCDVIEDKEESE